MADCEVLVSTGADMFLGTLKGEGSLTNPYGVHVENTQIEAIREIVGNAVETTSLVDIADSDLLDENTLPIALGLLEGLPAEYKNKVRVSKYKNTSRKNIESAIIFSEDGSVDIEIGNDVSPEELLHEILHASFDAFIDNNSDFKSAIEGAIAILSESSLMSDPKIREFVDNAKNNPKEFLPNLMSNSYLQKTINLENSEVITGIINAAQESLTPGEKNKTFLRKIVTTVTKVEEVYSWDDLYNIGRTEDEVSFASGKKITSTVAQDDNTDTVKEMNNEAAKIADEFNTLTEAASLGSGIKNLDFNYDMPIYSPEYDESDRVMKYSTPDEFNYALSSLNEGDLVRIPRLRWNPDTKEYTEDGSGKSQWVPIMRVNNGSAKVLVAKPHYKGTKVNYNYNSVPFSFVIGIRTKDNSIPEYKKDKSQKELQTIYNKYGKQAKKDKNGKKSENAEYNEEYYIKTKTGSVLPKSKHFSNISARLGADDLVREYEIDEQQKLKYPPNIKLLKSLKPGDLVRGKTIIRATKKGEKDIVRYAYYPVFKVGANGVQVITSNGNTYTHSFDSITSISLNKANHSVDYEKRFNEIIGKKKVKTKEGKNVEVASVVEEEKYKKKFLGTSVEEYNKAMRKKFGDDTDHTLTEEQFQARKVKEGQKLKTGDIVRIVSRITDESGKTKEVQLLREIVAVSPQHIYLKGKKGTIFKEPYSNLREIYLNIEEDAKNFEEFETLKEEIHNNYEIKNKKFRGDFVAFKKKHKDAKMFLSDYYLMEDVNVNVTGYAQFTKLKSGDIAKVKVIRDGKTLFFDVMVSGIVDGKVETITSYGKGAGNRNDYERAYFKFDDVVAIGFKKTKKLMQTEFDHFKKFRQRQSDKDPFFFKTEEAAERFNTFQKNITKKGEKPRYRALKRNGKYIKQKYNSYNKEYADVLGLDKYFTKIPSKHIENKVQHLMKGDIVRKKPVRDKKEYYQKVHSKVFNKDGELIGVRVAGGSTKEEATADGFFESFISIDAIGSIGFSNYLYDKRKQFLYPDLNLKRNTNTFAFNSLKEKPIQESLDSPRKSKRDDIKTLKKFVDRMKVLNPEIAIELLNTEGMKEKGIKPNARSATDGKTIYINTDIASKYDALHEYGHILMASIKLHNTELYEKITREALESNLAEEFRTLYPNLSNEALGEEIFVSALDKAIKLKGRVSIKTQTWLEEMFHNISEFFKTLRISLPKMFRTKDEIFNQYTNIDLMNMSLEELLELSNDKLLNEAAGTKAYNDITRNVGVRLHVLNSKQVKNLKDILETRMTCIA